MNYNLEYIDCWEFHEEFLKIVNPQIIICNGNGNKISAFSQILKNYEIDKKNVDQTKVYNTFSLKWTKIQDQGRERLVIGLPHLSRFNMNDYVFKMIGKLIRENAVEQSA